MTATVPAAPDDRPAVICRQLTYRFGTRTAVDHLDLEIHGGEIFGLLGPNGAGKTTTIRMLTTLLPCPKGSIEMFGVDGAARPMDTRRLLGYVLQQLSADATLTGRENMMLYTRLFDFFTASRSSGSAMPGC
jgi:ABC-2 type transport system ATP-binding protein